MSDVLGVVGMLLACGAAAAAIIAPRARWQPVAVGVALVAAPLLVLGDVWDDSQVVEARDSPALIATAVVGLVAAVGVGAAIVRRFEWALPVLVFGALALRVPLQIGGETSNLLVPLYLVIASAFVAGLGSERTVRAGRGSRRPWCGCGERSRRRSSSTRSSPSTARTSRTRWRTPGSSSSPSRSSSRSSPRSDGTRTNLTAAIVAIGIVGAGVALVALYQYAARDLFLNKELLDSNQLKPAFRVNSLFFDPNVLGRYLALGVIALGAAIAWSRGARLAALATAAGVLMLAGLALSYSITSVAALLAGMGVLAVLRYGLRGGLLAGAAVLLTGIVFATTGGADRSDLGPIRGLDEETSGRSALLEGGFDLIEEEPIIGWGSGAFGRAFFDEVRETKTTASHSEPINVAAEQGIPGVLVYVGLLVAMLWTLFGSGVTSSPGRAAAAAAAVALMVHSLGYASFLTDPATWAVLGVAVGLRRLEG